MSVYIELKKHGERLSWMMRRLEESRGFVSKRIIFQISCNHLVIYGTSFIARYEKFSCILNHKDIMIDNGDITLKIN